VLTKKGALAVVILSVGVYAGFGLAKQQAHRKLAEGGEGLWFEVASFLAVI
jgi:hypothetical protein